MSFLKKKKESEYSNYKEFTRNDFITVSNDENIHYIRREYIPWAMEHYGEWLREYQESAVYKYPDMSGSYRANLFNAIVKYSGYGYSHMKDCEIDIISEEMKKPIGFIPSNIIVYRLTVCKNFCERVDKERIYKGDIIEMPGFLSTGLIKEYLLENDELKGCDMLIKLYVPAGTRGIYTEYISHRPSEQEMLLDQNQRLKILDLKKKKEMTNVTACIA